MLVASAGFRKLFRRNRSIALVALGELQLEAFQETYVESDPQIQRLYLYILPDNNVWTQSVQCVSIILSKQGFIIMGQELYKSLYIFFLISTFIWGPNSTPRTGNPLSAVVSPSLGWTGSIPSTPETRTGFAHKPNEISLDLQTKWTYKQAPGMELIHKFGTYCI